MLLLYHNVGYFRGVPNFTIKSLHGMVFRTNHIILGEVTLDSACLCKRGLCEA